MFFPFPVLLYFQCRLILDRTVGEQEMLVRDRVLCRDKSNSNYQTLILCIVCGMKGESVKLPPAAPRVFSTTQRTQVAPSTRRRVRRAIFLH